MEQLTEQSIFNTVYVHLLTQNKHSQEDVDIVGRAPGVPSCMYRGPNGLKCAIGVLFTDEEYSPSMEGNCETGGSVSHLCRSNQLPERLRPHINILNRLQSVHDQNPPNQWKGLLAKLATEKNLSIPAM